MANAAEAAELTALVESARVEGADAFAARAWSWLGHRLRFAGGSVITSFAQRQSYVDIHTHGIADLRALMASYQPVRHLDRMGARLLAQPRMALVFAAEDPENQGRASRPLRAHLLRFGLEFGVGIAVPRADEEAVTVILLWRAAPEAAYSEAERARLDAAGPLLAELLAVNRAMTLLRDPRTGLAELAVALVDLAGHFVQTTPAFVRGYWQSTPPPDPHLPAAALAALRRGEVWPLPDLGLVLQSSPDAGRTLLLRLRPASRADVLSPREREVAALYAGGEGHRQIARRLFLSPATVRNHLSHCYRKLSVRNRIELLGALAWGGR